MDDISIQEMSGAIRSVDPKPFLSHVSSYIKTLGALPQGFHTPLADLPEKRRAQCEKWYSGILEESSKMRSRSTLSITRIINFRFKSNGHRHPEKTMRYFNKMKQHQVSLLLSINDDIEIIREKVKRSKEMREALSRFRDDLDAASTLMGVIRERIARRPTTLLRLQGSDRGIRELNHTFSDIRSYEFKHEKTLEDQMTAHPFHETYSNGTHLAKGTYSDILSVAHRIRQHSKELKEGEKLLVKLAGKGYSAFMKKRLELLIANHEERRKRFAELIYENRKQYFLGNN